MSPLMRKSLQALKSPQLLLASGDMDGAVNRAYYAMFDAAKAALTEGDKPLLSHPVKSHNGLITLFSQHLVKAGLVPENLGKNLNAVEELRLIADYKAEGLITHERGAWAVEAAEEFVQSMENLITIPESSSSDPSM